MMAKDFLQQLVLSRATDNRSWIEDQLACLETTPSERDLHIFLGLAPRKLGKADLALSPEEKAEAGAVRDGWHLEGWSLDGAARVLGLLAFNGRRPFADTFKDLRRTADAAELVALYRGLPLYPVPEALHFEVGEGLRSNLKPVFEAIAHQNPYPRDHFDEHRWNHMILKALFIDSPLATILGLEERANPELARILLDYAEERWAAGRRVSAELWIPVRPFAQDAALRPALDRAHKAGRLPVEVMA